MTHCGSFTLNPDLTRFPCQTGQTLLVVTKKPDSRPRNADQHEDETLLSRLNSPATATVFAKHETKPFVERNQLQSGDFRDWAATPER